MFRSFAKTCVPEFPADLTWLNSDVLTMKELRGKPVLIDFWTYSCVNCLHTLPHVKNLYKKYKKLGLTIVGVHSPEFEFEKDEKNVRNAIEHFGIEYSVVLDNDFAIWNAFANRVWPHVFLIDARGTIVFDHAGEGGDVEIEMAIHKTLQDIGVTKFPIVASAGTHGDGVCYRTTPETYLGYLRGSVGNAHDALPDSEYAFDDSADHVEGVPYLHGHWRQTSEYVEHTRSLPIATEYLSMKYSAFETNLVMGALDDREAIVEITLDGKSIPATMAGNDVVIDDSGKSHIHVMGHRLYSIIRADHYHNATLKISVRSAGLRMYAFTFGGCKT